MSEDPFDFSNIKEAVDYTSIPDSPIIQCARILRDKSRSMSSAIAIESSNESALIVAQDNLEPFQRMYIDLISTGTSSNDACKQLNIDCYLPILWENTCEKDGLYAQCISLIRKKEAKDLEEVIWSSAKNNPKSTLERMFAIKSRMDEYKDNAPPQTNLQTNINVTISDKDGNRFPYKVDTTVQEVEVQDSAKE